MKKVVVIGGGAAGMMAAASVAEMSAGSETGAGGSGGAVNSSRDFEVVICERNGRLGHKVTISGGGRCNVTTGRRELREVLKSYPRGAKFLKTAMYGFGPAAVYEWFEEQGVPLKTESDMRVFPVSDNGRDVVEVFEQLFERTGVEILYRKVVNSISKAGEKFEVEFGDGGMIEADAVVLATGGQAYRNTGSQGDGYRFAEMLGHSVTDLAPSLGSYTVAEEWPKALSGVSFENVRLKFKKVGNFEFSGPILFTHKGVSGPALFALSSLAAFEQFDQQDPAKLFIDFYPEKTYDKLHAILMKKIADSPKKSFRNVFGSFMVRSLANDICERLEIDENRVAGEVGKKILNRIVEELKNTTLSVIGRGSGSEFVTAGGVKLQEVNPNTMESKICQNLYFAGEILDVDGFTGGFNLQASWCMGRLVGKNIV